MQLLITILVTFTTSMGAGLGDGTAKVFVNPYGDTTGLSEGVKAFLGFLKEELTQSEFTKKLYEEVEKARDMTIPKRYAVETYPLPILTARIITLIFNALTGISLMTMAVL